MFFLAFPLVLLVICARVRAPEPRPSRLFRQEGQTLPYPISNLLHYPKALICCVLLMYLDGVMRVLFLPWGSIYVFNPPNIPYSTLLNSITMAGVVMAGTTMMSGMLGDLVGRRKVMVVTQLLTGLLVFPVFSLLRRTHYPSRMWPLTLFHALFFGVLNGFQQGCYPALLADIFPPPIRCTGVSVAYGLSRIPASAFFLVIMSHVDDSPSSYDPEGITKRDTMRNIGFYLVAGSLVGALFTMVVPVSKWLLWHCL